MRIAPSRRKWLKQKKSQQYLMIVYELQLSETEKQFQQLQQMRVPLLIWQIKYQINFNLRVHHLLLIDHLQNCYNRLCNLNSKQKKEIKFISKKRRMHNILLSSISLGLFYFFLSLSISCQRLCFAAMDHNLHFIFSFQIENQSYFVCFKLLYQYNDQQLIKDQYYLMPISI
ncbi:transmembrane protein, putative (macronuclear) [Tetrahymena thermophila SB210]|uniref:Transmembrane protein, putative n=1 Tax=Tetrahymena thermophila (strain SB210) TaxID=312017 RepID=W7XCW5_TETTS|nr:transmembrane protein, putative [Tetrahymena thermophila SB210]EWS74423.1 transmembrane protein, putative [Tetrahymena thermophila SB210]|eukprot:XP_012653000.1 transmembrane protein, putative [Tetrahymena thermophila SB210]